MRFLKCIWGELFIMPLVIVGTFLVSALLTAASLLLVFVKRNELKSYWKSVLQVWQRIIEHYKYILFILRHTLRERKEKKCKKENGNSRSSSLEVDLPNIDIKDLDPFSIFLLLYNSIVISFWLILIANSIYMAITLTVVYVNPVQNKKELPKAAPPTYEYEATVEDVQEANYGPWIFSYEIDEEDVKDPKFINLALINKDVGEIQFSKDYFVVFSQDKFSKYQCIELKNQHVEKGRINFYDHKNNEYSLNPLQAFQFLGEKSSTFVFDETGVMYKAETKDIKFTKTNSISQ